MAARTPGYEDSHRNEDPSGSDTANATGGRAKGSHNATDGDGCLGEGGDADSDDDDGRSMEGLKNDPMQATTARKKRKKPKKKKKHSLQQTSPPTVLLSDLFSTGNYPAGEIQGYTRTKLASAEAKIESRLATQDEAFFQNYRKAAEAHRTARKWVQDTAKPGSSLLQLAEGIEDNIRAVLGHPGLETGDSLKAGLGFPTGLCINNQVAHYTPNPGQKDTIVQQHDTLTVDFGVHIDGWIVDSAFTIAWDPMHDELLATVKDATNSGIKAAGIDVRISDVSAAIQEAMQSHEVTYNGKTFPVKPVRNLTAHDIAHWHIHGGKSIPFVKNSDQTKMEEGEIYAIETFGTTGRGYTRDDIGVYGYGLIEDAPLNVDLPLASAKRLHKIIRENFRTIVFGRRSLDRLGIDRYLAGLNCLVSHGIVEQYGQLMDVAGSYSAQFEHTLVLRENHKEVLSRGEDY